MLLSFSPGFVSLISTLGLTVTFFITDIILETFKKESTTKLLTRTLCVRSFAVILCASWFMEKWGNVSHWASAGGLLLMATSFKWTCCFKLKRRDRWEIANDVLQERHKTSSPWEWKTLGNSLSIWFRRPWISVGISELLDRLMTTFNLCLEVIMCNFNKLRSWFACPTATLDEQTLHSAKSFPCLLLILKATAGSFFASSFAFNCWLSSSVSTSTTSITSTLSSVISWWGDEGMWFLVADGFNGLVLVFSARKTSPKLSDAEVETEPSLLTMLSTYPSPSQDKSVSNSSCIGFNLGFFAGSVSSSLVIGSCSTGLWPQYSHKILAVTVVSYS